jgi:hypothetical protein
MARRTPDSFTAEEIATMRIAKQSLIEATARARARGLTQAEIEQEEDDDDSQFWADVAAIGSALREEQNKQ